jgi:hypothetical protein
MTLQRLVFRNNERFSQPCCSAPVQVPDDTATVAAESLISDVSGVMKKMPSVRESRQMSLRQERARTESYRVISDREIEGQPDFGRTITVSARRDIE